jgi:hypothetical protein
VQVNLSQALPVPVSFDYFTQNGTAVVGDYLSRQGRATFQAGVTRLGINLTIRHDTVREGDETFTFTVQGVPGTTIGSDTIVVTIIDND